MGLFRKVTSVSTLGMVDYRSDKERIARNTKKQYTLMKKQVRQPQGLLFQGQGTGQTQPPGQPPAQPPGAGYPPPPPAPPRSPQVTKKNLIIAGIIAIIIIVIIAVAASGNKDKKDTATASNKTTTSTPSGNSTSSTNSGSTSNTTTPSTTTTTPKPVPASMPYAGNGDSVISIGQPESGPVMLYITGNSGNRFFAVQGYDAKGNKTKLFVNTTESYLGYVLDPGGTTVQLEINATGSWAIESCSVRSARTITAPGTISGNGDEVLQVSGSASTATITGNGGARFFAVTGYNPSSNLMVDTTDVYQGTVRVPSKTTVLEINAEGAWEISLK